MEKLKLLIVEDNRFNQKFYDVSISGSVFEKQFAENGYKAMRSYKDWQPHIVLLDLNMPIMSGHTVLKEIRKKHRDTSTTIIISSASAERKDIMNCAKQGVQGYLIKPINPKEINQKILLLHKEAHPDKAAEIDALLQSL
jgi:two-component system sensor histidine kinase/response regulator